MNLSRTTEHWKTIALYGAWGIIFLAAVIAYWPGLDGPFLFDDFGSVAKLGDYGGVTSWETFRAFVFGGTAGPTGRPLALLTFLIDAQTWPADAWSFKRTNLVIHILNAGLLGLLTRQILEALGFGRGEASRLGLFIAGLWLLHPFLVSTTLYVVQRMAQLATLFMFAGLSGFVYGRRLIATNAIKGYVIMSLSLTVFTLLAVISKENGILLPVLAGVVEITVFGSARAGSQKLDRAWFAAFMVAPALVVFLYLVRNVFAADFFDVVPPRDFSIYERILTQSRVLVDYLQNWFVPKLYTTGVFQDHYIKSTGLFTPVTTFLSALGHVLLISFAWFNRGRRPLLALAVLFFYAGHLLESTVLNLELYFEHRNYLPAAFLFLPMVVWLNRKLDARSFLIVGLVLFTLLGSFTRYSASVWQSYDSMVATSAHKEPTSVRAQAKYAANLFNAGYIDDSFEVLDRAIGRFNDVKPLLQVHRLILSCHTQRLNTKELQRVAGILSGTAYDPRMLNMYKELTEAIMGRHCPDVEYYALESMFEGMLDVPPGNNPKSIQYSQVQYFLGYVRSYANQPDAAVQAFELSLQSRPGASSAMAMAVLLATNNHHAQALYLSDWALQRLKSYETKTLRSETISVDDIREFQSAVRTDLAAKQEGGISGRAE